MILQKRIHKTSDARKKGFVLIFKTNCEALLEEIRLAELWKKILPKIREQNEVNQIVAPVEGKVGSWNLPLFTTGFSTIQPLVGDGIFSHQQSLFLEVEPISPKPQNLDLKLPFQFGGQVVDLWPTQMQAWSLRRARCREIPKDQPVHRNPRLVPFREDSRDKWSGEDSPSNW